MAPAPDARAGTRGRLGGGVDISLRRSQRNLSGEATRGEKGGCPGRRGRRTGAVGRASACVGVSRRRAACAVRAMTTARRLSARRCITVNMHRCAEPVLARSVPTRKAVPAHRTTPIACKDGLDAGFDVYLCIWFTRSACVRARFSVGLAERAVAGRADAADIRRSRRTLPRRARADGRRDVRGGSPDEIWIWGGRQNGPG